MLILVKVILVKVILLRYHVDSCKSHGIHVVFIFFFLSRELLHLITTLHLLITFFILYRTIFKTELTRGTHVWADGCNSRILLRKSSYDKFDSKEFLQPLTAEFLFFDVKIVPATVTRSYKVAYVRNFSRRERKAYIYNITYHKCSLHIYVRSFLSINVNCNFRDFVFTGYYCNYFIFCGLCFALYWKIILKYSSAIRSNQ